MANGDSSNFASLLKDLATNDTLLSTFKTDPQGVATARGLSPAQSAALTSRDSNAIEAELKNESFEAVASKDPGYVRGPKLAAFLASLGT